MGYTRIQGALANLVHEVGRGTIANILKQHGIEPAPERQKRTTWQEFLKIHWDVHSALDFSTVDLWTATSVMRPVRHRSGGEAARNGRHRVRAR